MRISSCQVSRGRKWAMLGREHLHFSQFYFALHFSFALRVCKWHHSLFHMLDRSLILIQRYMYKCQGEWTQHLAAIYPLIYSLALPRHLSTQHASQSYTYTHSDLHQLFSAWNPCQETFKLSHGLFSSQAQRYPHWLHGIALQTEQGGDKGRVQAQARFGTKRLPCSWSTLPRCVILLQLHCRYIPIDPLLKTDNLFWKQWLKITII